MAKSKQFAVGDWTVGGVNCPIAEAGMTGREYADEVGDEFDEHVYMSVDGVQNESHIEEGVAKEQWESYIHYLEAMVDKEQAESMKDMYRAKLELANEVKSKLDW